MRTLQLLLARPTIARCIARCIAGFIAGLIAGCGETKAPPGADVPPPAAAPAAPIAAPAAPPVVTLTSNDGAKWQVDDHTRASMKRLGARLEAGPVDETPAGYRALANDLIAELQTLVQGCTMKGPAHDQLHVLLSAVIPRVSDLKETKEPAAAKKATAELREAFGAYQAAFESE